jgi:hypothetical protein
MNKKQKRISDYDNSGHIGVTETLGAITYMVFGGLKKEYKFYYQVMYQKRNTRVGYLMSIILISFLTYFIISISIE